MYEITCYDLDENYIDSFYQWDLNQKIIVKLENFDNVDTNTIAPKIHFTNKHMDKSIYMQSEIINGEIVVDVPNCLLEVASPIIVYYYFASQKNNLSQRTLSSVSIPVKAKNKPDEYKYKDNVKEYQFEDMIQQVLDLRNKINVASISEIKKYLTI